MIIQSDDVILFTGDSITDCGRNREVSTDLGRGYAFLVAAQLRARLAAPELKIYNRGVSGNRIYDLEGRLEPDLISLEPSIVSILIGINDVWRRYDSGKASELHDFRDSYRRVLEAIREKLDAQVLLLEPFVLPIPEDRKAWREDLDPKINAIRELAIEFGTGYIALDGAFAEAATRAPAGYWAGDGVHPSDAGHGLIADAWLDHAEVG